jgi:lipoprotein NlpI
MNRSQKRYIALMLKDRWNDIVNLIDLNKQDEKDFDAELNIIEELLGELDPNDEFLYGKD